MDQHAPDGEVAARSRAADEEMLARIRSVREEVAEARRARGPREPLDAAELAVIEELTSAPDARPGYRLLRSRVEAGALTWDQVWADEHGSDAVSLKLAVMKRLYSRAALQPALDHLAAIGTAVTEDPDRFWQRVEEQQRERDAGTEGTAVPGPGQRGGAPGTLGSGPAGPRSSGGARRGDDGSGAGSRG